MDTRGLTLKSSFYLLACIVRTKVKASTTQTFSVGSTWYHAGIWHCAHPWTPPFTTAGKVTAKGLGDLPGPRWPTGPLVWPGEAISSSHSHLLFHWHPTVTVQQAFLKNHYPLCIRKEAEVGKTAAYAESQNQERSGCGARWFDLSTCPWTVLCPAPWRRELQREFGMS